MNLMEMIERARELIGGGGIEGLAENALSDVVPGEGGGLDTVQQAAEALGEGGDASGDPPAGSAN